MTFLRFFFFFVWCALGKQPIKFHPQISQVSPLSRFAQSFLHKKNSLHNIMAEQGPKVGDARSLWNFTPSPGILLYTCSFFLSLCLLRVCCDDDDDVLVLGTFVSRVWIFETMMWKRCAISRPPSRASSLSLSKTRLLSKRFRFCASLLCSL